MLRQKHQPMVLLTLVWLLLSEIVHAQGFSADTLEYFDDSGSPQGSRVFVQGNKLRLEQYKPGSRQLVGIILIDLDRHTTLMLIPEQRSYMDISGATPKTAEGLLLRPGSAGDACPTLKKFAAQEEKPLNCRKLGRETTNGRTAIKYEGSEAGDQQKSYIWIDEKLNVILKMVDKQSRFEVQNLKEGTQPASLFDMPSGYHKMEDMREIGKPPK